ncbi:homeobox protein prospero [Plakobranchus ocellatus]|uniref:Homeobox protein prospero n=1 Tax=Plakobranchus ocellatus TaxID=259542 RepID=A0AAV3ZJ20_9GAST|nr:homeobox protein prospero [Plakobranchus ocellatus]
MLVYCCGCRYFIVAHIGATREFFYIQMEKYARQALAEGVKNEEELVVTVDSELFRHLNLHYNRNNQIEIEVRGHASVQAMGEGKRRRGCGRGRLVITVESELFRHLNLHSNRNNQIEVRGHTSVQAMGEGKRRRGGWRGEAGSHCRLNLHYSTLEGRIAQPTKLSSTLEKEKWMTRHEQPASSSSPSSSRRQRRRPGSAKTREKSIKKPAVLAWVPDRHSRADVKLRARAEERNRTDRLEKVSPVLVCVFSSRLPHLKKLPIHCPPQPSRLVPPNFLVATQAALREFFKSVQANKDAEPSWKKAIYKIIARMDETLPDFFKAPNWMEQLGDQ